MPSIFASLPPGGPGQRLQRQLLFPILFITVACGAMLGLPRHHQRRHHLEADQKQSDTRAVGYGAVLEGLVAVLALATVMILAPGDGPSRRPSLIFAKGLAGYLGIGVDFTYGTLLRPAGLLDLRLTRWTFARAWRATSYGASGLAVLPEAVAATFITLALPLVFLMLTRRRATWWPGHLRHQQPAAGQPDADGRFSLAQRRGVRLRAGADGLHAGDDTLGVGDADLPFARAGAGTDQVRPGLWRNGASCSS